MMSVYNEIAVLDLVTIQSEINIQFDSRIKENDDDDGLVTKIKRPHPTTSFFFLLIQDLSS